MEPTDRNRLIPGNRPMPSVEDMRRQADESAQVMICWSRCFYCGRRTPEEVCRECEARLQAGRKPHRWGPARFHMEPEKVLGGTD